MTSNSLEEQWPICNMACLRYVLLFERDLPKAIHFFKHGLGASVNIATEKWAELKAGNTVLALKETEGWVFFLKVLSAVQLAGQTLTNSVCMAVSFPPNGSILLLFATWLREFHDFYNTEKRSATRATRQCWFLMYKMCRARWQPCCLWEQGWTALCSTR